MRLRKVGFFAGEEEVQEHGARKGLLPPGLSTLQRKPSPSPRKKDPLSGLSAEVSESALELSPGGSPMEQRHGKGLAETALLEQRSRILKMQDIFGFEGPALWRMRETARCRCSCPSMSVCPGAEAFQKRAEGTLGRFMGALLG